MTKAHAQYVCLLDWLLEERRKRDVSTDEEYKFACELEELWEQLTEAERAEISAQKT